MEDTFKKYDIAAEAMLNDYEILINELYKLPCDLRSLDDIISDLKTTYTKIKKCVVYKYEADDFENKNRYYIFLGNHFWKCHDTFVQKQLLFNELDSRNYKYNPLLDSYFYKVYMKRVLCVILGESEAINHFYKVDNLEIINEDIFIQTHTIYDHDAEDRKPLIAQSVNVLFKDFLKSDFYNKNK